MQCMQVVKKYARYINGNRNGACCSKRHGNARPQPLLEPRPEEAASKSGGLHGGHGEREKALTLTMLRLGRCVFDGLLGSS